MITKENAKNVTEHVQADAPMVMSAMNVTHLAEPVPDMLSRNVLTVGVELNVTTPDVVCAMVIPDLKLMEISVNKLDASAKAVMLATRINVSTVLMDLTFSTANAMHAASSIVLISINLTSHSVHQEVSATMLVCATVTQMTQTLMITNVVCVAWAVLTAVSMKMEMLHVCNVTRDMYRQPICPTFVSSFKTRHMFQWDMFLPMELSSTVAITQHSSIST